MQAYHHNHALKAQYLDQVRRHRHADEIIHGYYWEYGKGCAVGCTIHGNDYTSYETILGIPCVLAGLEDRIFENLSPPDDILWPERFLDAIPVGADLTMVWPHFAIALLGDTNHGVLRYVEHQKFLRQKESIENILSLYNKWVNTGEKPDYATAAAATAAAYAAAREQHWLWQADTLLRLLSKAPVVDATGVPA